jgi:hypothetical protein
LRHGVTRGLEFVVHAAALVEQQADRQRCILAGELRQALVPRRLRTDGNLLFWSPSTKRLSVSLTATGITTSVVATRKLGPAMRGGPSAAARFPDCASAALWAKAGTATNTQVAADQTTANQARTNPPSLGHPRRTLHQPGGKSVFFTAPFRSRTPTSLARLCGSDALGILCAGYALFLLRRAPSGTRRR